MASSYRFVVGGRVQGVGFRYSVANEARRLGVSGWVRNREDGAVEGLAQGTADSLEQLRAWLQRGPRAAAVESVQWTPSEESPHAGFAIRA